MMATGGKIWCARRCGQRGVTLFVVMAVVLLVTLMAAWAARSALFSEIMVGADADYQRAFDAAQIILQDAELDIQGLRADGTACMASIADPKICRKGAGIARFPGEAKEAVALLADLGAGCKNGLCSKFSNAQDIWNDRNLDYAKRIGGAARYGEYTGALAGSRENDLIAIDNGGDSDNWGSRLLQRWSGASDDGAGAWYWIEVLPYEEAAGFSGLIEGASASGAVSLNLKPNVVYRITALARGFRKGTQVVLQEVYVPQVLDY
jgi:type IV pilus assembly protein PilX